jgi:hypothetical protein
VALDFDPLGSTNTVNPERTVFPNAGMIRIKCQKDPDPLQLGTLNQTQLALLLSCLPRQLWGIPSWKVHHEQHGEPKLERLGPCQLESMCLPETPPVEGGSSGSILSSESIDTSGSIVSSGSIVQWSP